MEKFKIDINRNWMNTHPEMEKHLNLDDNHVIINRQDWEELLHFLSHNSDLIQAIQHSINNRYENGERIKDHERVFRKNCVNPGFQC